MEDFDLLESVNSVIENIVSANWVQEMVSFLIAGVMIIVGVIISPITSFISTQLPELDDALSKLGVLFDYALIYMSWLISLLGIPSFVMTAIVGYYTFLVTSKLSFFGLKLGMKWYKALK